MNFQRSEITLWTDLKSVFNGFRREPSLGAFETYCTRHTCNTESTVQDCKWILIREYGIQNLHILTGLLQFSFSQQSYIIYKLEVLNAEGILLHLFSCKSVNYGNISSVSLS